MKRNHIHSYSDDPDKKRKQICDYLQKGIVLENSWTFIPWKTKYKDIGKYAQKRTDSGDRTVWYLGEQKILDGLTCHMEVMKWSTQPDNSTFDQLYDNLGYDRNGNDRFLNRIEHITNLLGQPDKKELEKFGTFDLGEAQWVINKVKIAVVGVEIFNCRYSLHIGLIDNSHNRDQKKAMDKLRAQGWTDEDFGK